MIRGCQWSYLLFYPTVIPFYRNVPLRMSTPNITQVIQLQGYERRSIPKSHMYTIANSHISLCKNPRDKLQAAKLDCDATNPSVLPTYPRSKALHYYAKETRDVPIQYIVSFLRIQSIGLLISSSIT